MARLRVGSSSLFRGSSTDEAPQIRAILDVNPFELKTQEAQ